MSEKCLNWWLSERSTCPFIHITSDTFDKAKHKTLFIRNGICMYGFCTHRICYTGSHISEY